MAIDSDFVVDRRRLKRRLTLWRVIAIAAIVAAVVVGLGRFESIAGKAHVARLFVDGIIVDDHTRMEALRSVAEDDNARALIVVIDSPGGTVVGGEALFRQLRRVAERKPVVSVLREFATSAAYMTAVGGDYIVAREGTVTGSIGVIIQTTQITELLDKIGVSTESIKSGPLKAQPNPLEPLTPAAREAIEAVIADVYDMFVALVAERRSLGTDQVAEISDGRIFTGSQALNRGLIDAIGGEPEARTWLAESKGVDEDLPVQDLDLDGPEEQLRKLVGQVFGKVLFSERLSLDGLLSLWHPAL